MKNLFSSYARALAQPSMPGSIGLLILRCVAGLALMHHGWGKIQTPFSWMGPDAPVPGFLQFLAAISEFGGGLAWILGLLTQLASFGLICTMIVAVYTHVSQGAPFVGRSSYEPAISYLALSIFMFLNGPGRLSIDRKLFR